MIRHQRTFHAGIKVNLSWGGTNADLNDIVDLLLKENNCVRDVPPKDESHKPPHGCCVYCGEDSWLIWFEKKPSFKTMGTVAHEIFHLWHYWVQKMDRDLNVNRIDPANLEVDAYFFSDVCDWIYDCVTKK